MMNNTEDRTSIQFFYNFINEDETSRGYTFDINLTNFTYRMKIELLNWFSILQLRNYNHVRNIY